MDAVPIAPWAAAANGKDAIVIFYGLDIYLVFVVLHDR
jgi:hypothetical protein